MQMTEDELTEIVRCQILTEKHYGMTWLAVTLVPEDYYSL